MTLVNSNNGNCQVGLSAEKLLLPSMASMNQQLLAYLVHSTSTQENSFSMSTPNKVNVITGGLPNLQQQMSIISPANTLLNPVCKPAALIPLNNLAYNGVSNYTEVMKPSVDIMLEGFQKTLLKQQQQHQQLMSTILQQTVPKPCASLGGGKGLKRPRSSLTEVKTSSYGLQTGATKSVISVSPQKKTRNGRRVCLVDGCVRFAQGRTKRCISHGGGKRCGHTGCPKSAYGSTKFCIAHGGGERCEVEGCHKSSQGSTKRCKAHGGGRRCTVRDCPKSAQGSMFCKAHGGGKRCSIDGCNKQARGRSGCCIIHGKVIQLN